MIVFHRPGADELWFRAALLSDALTMSYNDAWGGAIGFPGEQWEGWYDRWLVRHGGQRFYRYLLDSDSGRFVGEAAWHFSAEHRRYLADVIVSAAERGRGFGEEGLTLLCEAARMRGIAELWDELAPGNGASLLFRKLGFSEEGRGTQGVLFRKDLGAILNRVLVIGCPGAGKSTFARALRDMSALPLYYLDMLFHRPDRTTAPREEFDAALARILARPKWIIDGNYQRTLPQRFAACDTVYYLDLPLEECLEGAGRRIGQPREDMPWVEDRFDPEFRQYILDFPRDQRPAIEALIEQYRREKRIVVFRSRAETAMYLRSLRPTDEAQNKEDL